MGMWRTGLELPSGTTKAKKCEFEHDMGSAWTLPASNARDRKAPATLLRVIIMIGTRSLSWWLRE